MKGTLFYIPHTDPLNWGLEGPAPDLTSGKEFHRQLENPFYFETDTEASKESSTKTVVLLPRTVQGKTRTQVTVHLYKCMARVPCRVSFKLGFLPQFETGTEKWCDRGELVCVDSTNVKVDT